MLSIEVILMVLAFIFWKPSSRDMEIGAMLCNLTLFSFIGLFLIYIWGGF